jgi:PAS domain S-box-containing protein
MNWQTSLYFSSILLTFFLTGFLAWYAWRQPSLPGIRAFAALMLSECLLALAEILSMLGGSQEQALFWFNLRVIFIAIIPVLWLGFALEYSGRRDWLSKRLLTGMFIIPLITQAMLWSNSLHGLWIRQEVAFHQNGPFWIVETGARIPGIWFMVHSIYSLLLLLAGIGVIFFTAWNMRRPHRNQALLLSCGALASLGTTLTSIFNLLPQFEFNLFTPGIGISAIFYAQAVFQFQFLKNTPAEENMPRMTRLDSHERRSLAVLFFIFTLFVSGLAAAGFLTYQNYERQFRAQVESQLEAIAALKADDLRDWRAERLADAGLFYRNENFSERVRNYLENPQDAEAQTRLLTWLEKVKASPDYDRVFLLDARGVERISLPADPEALPTDLVEQASASLASGQVVFLDFHRHSNDDAVHLSLLVPIFDAQDNQPLGVLVLRIDPNIYLYPFIQRWPVPSETAETLLIRREGEETVFLNSLRFQSDAALNLRFPLEETQLPAVKAVLGQTGIVEGLDYRGVEVIADIRSVPNSPWFLVSKMDRAEAYAPLRARLWQTTLFFGVLCVAVGAGLFVIWRQQRMRYYRAQARIADALRASEEKFRLAFETSPDSVAITRLSDGMFVSVNKGFEQVTGYTREQVIGKTSLEINLWKDPEDRRKIVEGLQARGEVRNYEAPFLTRHGEIVGLMSAAIIQLNGEPHILNITRDITARKQAEAALRKSEKLLREIAANYPNSYLSIIEKDLTIGFTSGQEFRKQGLDPDSFVGLTLEQVFGEHAPFVRENYLKAFGGAETEFELFIDNQHQLYRAVPLAGEDGRVEKVLAVVENITERKRAEMALQEAEARYRALVEQIPAIIYRDSVEQTGQTLYISPQIETVLGYVPGEWMADKDFWIEIMHPDDRERVSAAYAQANETGQPFSAEYRLVRPDGRDVWIRDEAALVYGPSGSPLFWQGILLDITERKQAEEQLALYTEKLEDMVEARTRELRAAQEKLVRQERLATLGQLAGSIGHELRNPLGVIANAVYYLKLTQPQASDRVKEYLDIIENETRASDKIVTDLLDYTRVKSLDLVPVSVSGAVQATLERHPAPPSVKVTLAIPPDLPSAYADPRHVEQVLGNLVVNACQSMTNGGKMTIAAAINDDMIAITVQDTGVGIPPENLEKIFEPLFTTKSRGIGLGLAVSQKLAEANGGRIEVQSTSSPQGDTGVGSAFTLYLPVCKEA